MLKYLLETAVGGKGIVRGATQVNGEEWGGMGKWSGDQSISIHSCTNCRKGNTHHMVAVIGGQ